MTTETVRKPNVLIIVPDQLRHDAMSCAGHPVFRTPSIDRLASEGVRFTRAYCNAPLCMPTRASVLTGTYPHNHQIQNNQGTVPTPGPGRETLATLLRGVGYRSAYIGKAHYFWDGAGRSLVEREPYMAELGFDEAHLTAGPRASFHSDSYLTRRWQEKGLLDVYREDFERRHNGGGPVAVWASPLPVEEHMDTYVGRVAVEWLERADAAQPFCLWVGFGGPHEPWDAPGEYATMYDPESIAAPLPAEQPGEIGEWVPEHARERMLMGRDPRLTAEACQRVLANYGGKISLVDHWVGKILDTLEARGLAEDTLVVFWSDHGEMGGDHERIYKSVFYESSVRVPYIPPEPYSRRFYEGDERDPAARSMDPVWRSPWFATYFKEWMAGVTDIEFVKAQYDASIAYADACLNRVLDRLEALGHRDDTIVVLCADHGEELDEHGCWFDHHGLYETNVHIPLLIRFPHGQGAGQVIPDLVTNLDITPTVLDVLGLPEIARAQAMPGRSLVPLTKSQQIPPRDAVYLTECTWMRKRGWRTGEWKLIISQEPDIYGFPSEELYHLPSDRGEAHNLAAERREVVKALRHAMDSWIARRLAETGLPDPIVAQAGALRTFQERFLAGRAAAARR